ncbi:regulator of nonsense transcripts 3B-like [Scleropages formosus]|uniref:Regulator of nonsense transcripts 3B-like n=1 Tax=Scleropages formosus TaxID=113540 RepID=A0A0P7WPF9_SCLFO|nr:regulator of nonsense transcripts 3B isoform X2 [Scleropages formosus]KPP63236.1 regulator of nonsense transcripts 3B-like [Scleropages formosus]
MKEDKENARPREKKVEIRCDDSEKSEKPNKEKKEALTKIVIRRLPPGLTKEELEEQLQPIPEVDYLEFFSNDTSLYPHLFSRAYINFKNQEDIVLFRDRFDGYVFIDNRGQEYPAIVEFAPFQKTAKKRNKKKDAKTGTIEEDPDYKKFLENYYGDDEKLTSTPETLLEEIEAKTKELVAKKTTPLLDFLKNKQRLREEKKEERRKRELERKRLREEERRKWREEDRRKRKEAEKHKKGEKIPDKEREKPKEEPKIKLLKKPEKGDDVDTEKPKDKVKKIEKDRLKDDRTLTMEFKKRPNGETRDDRGRKQDEDGRRDYRDWDMDRDRERRQREKERLRRQDEERRRKRERLEAESSYKKREEEVKKPRDRTWEKRTMEISGDQAGNIDKSAKEERKEDSIKRDRVRNKDRPAIQLYQPGARSRNRTTMSETSAGEKKVEGEAKSSQEKGEE